MRRRTRRSRRGCWPRRPAPAEAERRIDAARHAADRGHPRAGRRARRDRGLPARLFAVHQGGPGADGAGGGAAARARRRHRRPPDRGQARHRRLGHRRAEVGRASWSRPRPGRSASPRGSSSPARRRKPSSTACSSGSACRRCAPRRGRRCGSWARISCSGRPSRRRCGAPARIRTARYSFDMLGEGARTAADARRYLDAYAAAIDAIGAQRRRGRAAGPARHLGQALGAASALRGGVARARARGARAGRARARAQGARPRSQFHRRCRGGRPARTDPRRDRARCSPIPSLRGWEGFGLAVQAYQKRARSGDRLARRGRARARPPADGAAGQGRLLGHRGQARAGARARRLSGVHPQGDDRPLLRRLHAPAAGGAGAALSRNSPPTMRSRSRA